MNDIKIRKELVSSIQADLNRLQGRLSKESPVIAQEILFRSNDIWRWTTRIWDILCDAEKKAEIPDNAKIRFLALCCYPVLLGEYRYLIYYNLDEIIGYIFSMLNSIDDIIFLSLDMEALK